MTMMERRIPERPETPERWQQALKRARREGVQIRQLAGCGMWIATSVTDDTTAYEVTPWSCECWAAEFGDPICKHRAALLAKLGRLGTDSTGPREDTTRCTTCNGVGSHPGTVAVGSTWRYDNVTCEDCHGTGLVHTRSVA
jgi:hypothetical protein